MLTSKRIFVIILLFASQFSNNLKAQCDVENAIFPITQEEQAFLYYWNFYNPFDSAYVNCTIGEFRVLNNNSINWIIITRPYNIKNEFQGDSIQGEDHILRSKAFTNSFVYSLNSSLKFFRELSVGVPCDKSDNFPSGDETDNLSWIEKLFVTGVQRILDRTEFVIQLVRSSDDAVLFTIDSVGIDVNPNSIVAPAYGTQPFTMNRTVTLPNAYAGEEVYIRVSPRRWGSTPYGILLTIRPSWISLSSIKEYGENNYFNTEKCSEAEYSTLDSVYFANLLTHCDTVKSITGKLPEGTIARKLLTKEQQDTIIKYYYDSIYINGKKYYEEKNYDTPYTEILESKISDKERAIEIQKVYPNPLRDNIINFEIKSSEDFSGCYFELTDLEGRFFLRSTNFNLHAGKNSINRKLNIYPGTYIIIFKTRDNRILGFTKMIKQ